jgi:hypothetical protein
MDLFYDLISFIAEHLMRGIFISVLVIIFFRKFFKKIDTQIAAQIIRGLLIAFSAMYLLFLLISLLSSSDADTKDVFWERISGPYGFAYLSMIIGNSLPLLLLFKKTGNNIYMIMFMAIAINIGWLMESIIICLPALFRGDCPSFSRQSMILLKGAFLGLVIILTGHLISKSKNKV